MNEFWSQLHTQSAVFGGLVGAVLAVAVVALMWRSWKVAAARDADLLQAQLSSGIAERDNRLDELRESLEARENALSSTEQELSQVRQNLAIVKTRLEEQSDHFKQERAGLVDAEKRLEASFDRLAGKVFDQRSKQFTELSEKQLDGLLKPLVKDIEGFRNRVDETHREEIQQHAALREKLQQLENLNQSLNTEAKNLTRALTADVKTQGGWGEQQLEKLLEIGGLIKGDHYQTQMSVQDKKGKNLRPDLVLMLPENRTIVVDSKVSLTAWTRLQAADDDGQREIAMSEHIKSIKAHIDILASKNYTDAESLNALDFVLMFVPIESALIAALQQEPELPEYALRKRIALLSPANFLATVRTVASVWTIHKQNIHARDIASRASMLYDKFVGFTNNLTQVGARLDQAKTSYDAAVTQLSSGSGNLVRQAEMLRTLGVKHQKQLDSDLRERARLSSGDEELIDGETEVGSDEIVKSDPLANRPDEDPLLPDDTGQDEDSRDTTLQ